MNTLIARNARTALVVGALAVLTAGCGSGGAVPGTASTGSASTSGAGGAQTETSSQDHPGVDRVEITGDSADVVFRTGPDGSAGVERALRWTGTKPEVSETVDGSVLRITAKCPGGVVGGDRCSVRLTVTVPAATAATTDLGAGDVAVSDVAGALDLKTSAGDVRGTGLRATRVGARSSAGDVDLTFAVAPQDVDVQSAAGDITVRVPAGSGYRVQASASVGDVTTDIRDDPTASARIVARAGAGDVTVTGT